jgi:tetratricopeptide (TPR) repeat protein
LYVAARIEQDQMILANTEHRDADTFAALRRCAGYLDAMVKTGRANRENLQNAAGAYSNVGQALMNLHHFDEAVNYGRRSIELAGTVGSPPFQTAASWSLIANASRQAGDVEGALRAITEARTLAQKISFPGESTRVLSLYAILWRQGVILGREDTVSLNRPDDAIEPLQTAFDMVDQQAAKDPNDFVMRERVATSARELGAVVRLTDPPRALAIYDRAVMRQREIKNNVTARRQEAVLLANSAYPLRSLHRNQEARERIDAAIELLRAIKDYPAAKVPLGEETDAVMRAAADHEAETGHPDRALAAYRDLLDRVMATKLTPETDLRQANDLSRIYLAMARLCRKTGDAAEAARLDNQRLDLWRKWDQNLPHNSFILRQLAIL